MVFIRPSSPKNVTRFCLISTDKIQSNYHISAIFEHNFINKHLIVPDRADAENVIVAKTQKFDMKNHILGTKTMPGWSFCIFTSPYHGFITPKNIPQDVSRVYFLLYYPCLTTLYKHITQLTHQGPKKGSKNKREIYNFDLVDAPLENVAWSRGCRYPTNLPSLASRNRKKIAWYLSDPLPPKM